jgi:hypothetical protein
MAKQSDVKEQLVSKLRSIDLPKYKKFDLEKYTTKNDEVAEPIRVFPNPAKETFTIEIQTNEEKAALRVEVTNAQGQSFFAESLIVDKFKSITIDSRELPKGFYVVKIYDGKNLVVRKVVKE